MILTIRLPLRPGLALAASLRSSISAPSLIGDTFPRVIPSGGSLSSSWNRFANALLGAATRTRAVPPAGIFTGVALRIFSDIRFMKRPETATSSSWAGTRCR